jgi:hypothetical protein
VKRKPRGQTISFNALQSTEHNILMHFNQSKKNQKYQEEKRDAVPPDFEIGRKSRTIRANCHHLTHQSVVKNLGGCHGQADATVRQTMLRNNYY